jgi:hypothetical protein
MLPKQLSNNYKLKKFRRNNKNSLLKEAYDILQMDAIIQNDTKRHFEKPQRPDREVSINLNLPDPNTLNKSDRARLSKVLAFIDTLKRWRFADGNTVIPISCTNVRLELITGSVKQTSRLIQYMKQLGLIATWNNTYRFNAKYDKFNRCKTYVYSAESEKALKEFCKNNDIEKAVVSTITKRPSMPKNIDTITFDKKEVRFCSKLNLPKPDDMSKKEFENYLLACLYENYEFLEEYQLRADLINQKYYSEDPDRQVRFTPRFTWSRGKRKKIIKIGIRATNKLVSAKKEWEEGDENKKLVYRKDVLKKLGLTDHKEYDVKSSIARVTYLMNTGDWLDDNVDLYEIMFKTFVHLCPDGKYSESDWDEETRAVFKYFHMRGYFDTYAKMSLHIKNELRKRIKFSNKQWQGFDQMIKSYKDSIKTTVGDLMDSEVFYHESCIYIDVLLALLETGVNVLQIYDGFFVPAVFSGDIASIIKASATNYYNKISHKIINNNNSIINHIHNNINNNNIYNNITFSYNKTTTTTINNININNNNINNNNNNNNNNNITTIIINSYNNNTSTKHNLTSKQIYKHTYIPTVPVNVHNKLYTTIVDIFGTTGPPVTLDYHLEAPP